ncbi:MAG: hypothetical protein R6X02_08495 [Enhygromyxa sp.]
MASPLLRALLHARPDVPEVLARFDEIARAGGISPSFEEYSARIGERLQPWRETCYFDLADPGRAEVAHEQLFRSAEALGFSLAEPFVAALRAGVTSGPDVLQIVLGLDAGDEASRARLKYYLIFQADSDATVERLRVALDAPAPPASLRPGSVYILGLDFDRLRLRDFKLYVRLAPERVPAVIRNLGEFAALWRGSRYLVFQHCLLSPGRQVYFHAAAAELLEDELARRRGEPAVAALLDQVRTMNEVLPGRLRPWIASFPWVAGELRRSPSNVYFHFDG